MDHEGGRASPMPRALKIAGAIAVGLIVLLAGVLAMGGTRDSPGGHGSGNHMGSAGGMHGNQTGGGHQATGNDSEGMRTPITWMVDVTDDAFAPVNLTIQVGDTVRWTHAGSNPHTVTEDSETFDSHPDCPGVAVDPLDQCMGNGDTYERTFDELGQVNFHCKIHAAMTGSIDVRERYDPGPAGHGPGHG